MELKAIRCSAAAERGRATSRSRLCAVRPLSAIRAEARTRFYCVSARNCLFYLTQVMEGKVLMTCGTSADRLGRLIDSL